MWVIMVRVQYLQHAEGPCLVQMLGLEKNCLMQNSRKWDCSKDATNAKILNLCLNKPKPRKWIRDFRVCGESPVQESSLY